MKVPFPARPKLANRLFRVENGGSTLGRRIVKLSWKLFSQLTSVSRKISSLPAITKPKRAGSPAFGTRL
jgi:hypothetical protein